MSRQKMDPLTRRMAELPAHLYAAHQWISAAGEWNDAVTDPAKYAAEAAENARENEQPDVNDGDLLEVIQWHIRSVGG